MANQKLQTTAIDICDWLPDEEFGAVYPEGARPKKPIFSPAAPAEDFIKPAWRHMFKRSSKWAPEQYWCEIIAHHIAEMMSINTPPTYAAVDTTAKLCGALSPWFYDEQQEQFFPAGMFHNRLIENFDREKGTQHNLLTSQQFNQKCLGDSQIYDFWSMLLFDSVIGNTDRHQDNWGHLIQAVRIPKSIARRRKNEHKIIWKFSPWFDNGTSLGYEIPPQKFRQWNAATLDRYIERGRHHIRYAPDNLVRMGHLDSIRFITKHNALVTHLLRLRIKRLNITAIADMIYHFCSLQMPFNGELTSERADFMIRLTGRRIELLMDILK